MIPVFGVPILNKPALFDRMMGTVDHPIKRLYIVDNGGIISRRDYPHVGSTHIADLGYNAGVAASWNLIIKANMNASYWVIGCNDMTIERGILAEVERQMEEVGDSEPHLLRVRIGNEDWGNHFGLFAMNPSLIDEVGWFDENLHPVYWEDTDYLARVQRSGNVRLTLIGTRSHHDGNASWKDNPSLAASNKVSWGMNVKYFDGKWGVQDGKQNYTLPFNRAGTIKDWNQPSLYRLRQAQWKEVNNR